MSQCFAAMPLAGVRLAGTTKTCAAAAGGDPWIPPHLSSPEWRWHHVACTLP
jgi:hypothetical protein